MAHNKTTQHFGSDLGVQLVLVVPWRPVVVLVALSYARNLHPLATTGTVAMHADVERTTTHADAQGTAFTG